MNIQFQSHGAVSVASIHGSIDSLTAPTVLSELGAHVEAGNVHMVADLGGVDYTSSAGLRALLATVKAARHGGGDLRLACIHANVMKVLQLSGFTTILKIYDDVEAAVASFDG